MSKNDDYTDNQRMKELMKQYHEGTEEERKAAIEEIINLNEGFFGFMINKYFSDFKKEYYQDLYNTNVVAVLENLDKFDPDKGTFTTFFTVYAIHAMSNFVHRETNKTTTYYSGHINKVKAAIQYFKSTGNHTPSVSDISLKTGLAIPKVERAMEMLTMTDQMSYESDVTDASLRQHAESPEDMAIQAEKNEVIIAALKDLQPVDREILAIRYGLGDNEPVDKIRKISQMTHIPTSRVSASLQRSISVLRHNPRLRSLIAPDLTKYEKRAQGPELVPIDDDSLIASAYDSMDEEYDEYEDCWGESGDDEDDDITELSF